MDGSASAASSGPDGDSGVGGGVEAVHLRAAGTSVLIALGGAARARVVHVGADLGPTVDLAALLAATAPGSAVSTLDQPSEPYLVRCGADGWVGRPTVRGHRGGRAFSPRFVAADVARLGGSGVRLTDVDPAAGLTLTTELHLEPGGLLRVRHELRNDGPDRYEVTGVLATVPLPARAGEILDLTGRWSRERHPQRHPLATGTWSRESRRGRTGHDATLALAVGTPGFGFRCGEVWAVHLAWSGDHVSYAERLPDGAGVLGAGELLAPGEVVLAPGAAYPTPWLLAAYSGDGLDGISRAFHRWMRARPTHPHRSRPVVLNTWEAVYFDHRLDRLVELADTAAAIGVERFVLDDGWFGARRDDRAGLGDWYVSPQVWPQGLGPLVDHVRGLGMEFGLWVEPEMVNPDSDLYRAHPDWILHVADRVPPLWRHQQVLDLAHPQVYAHLLDRLDALLSQYAIGYLKWDHNRDLVDAGHADRPAVHAQTLAAYRLLDALRERHPGVEIESCASGGARADLGILQHTDRIWASDCNDALERQTIQRWTGLVVPPELVGAHVGPPRSHTTGRTHALAFRAATALFGHAGLEWDVTGATSDERAALTAWTAFYRAQRDLLHTGDVVRADHPDPSAYLHGVVAGDRSRALYAYVQLTSLPGELPVPARLPGLDPDRAYRVAAVHPAGAPAILSHALPAWYAAGGVTLPGRVLDEVGVRLPVLLPEQALLLAVDPA